jgi:adenylate cyclase, class 2
MSCPDIRAETLAQAPRYIINLLYPDHSGFYFAIMKYINIEIKARTDKPGFVRDYLRKAGADYKGTDLQTDTYFRVPSGRLKLRQGKIENNLIFYDRPNQEGPKQSDFMLHPVQDSDGLKTILTKALGIKVTVTKKREIYYINNIKFHIDELEGLGSFVEIEAGNKLADLSVEQLNEQCRFYMQELGIAGEDLLSNSYSDMLLEKPTSV